MTLWVDLRGGEAPQWMGWRRRCHAVCVFGSWYGHATMVYSGLGGRTIKVKPCSLPQRVSMGHGNHSEEECGGPIFELPDQAAMLAAFMVGGADAVETLLTPTALAAVRAPRPW